MALEDAVNPIKGASGPGKYAKRLDRMPANAYGDQKETASFVNKSTPLATTPDTRPAPASEIKQAATSSMGEVTPLFAPTQRPNEPVTNGIDAGAGEGSSALMMKKSSVKLSDTLAQMLPYDTDGSIAILYQDALARGN
jgi:hypothetical protein